MRRTTLLVLVAALGALALGAAEPPALLNYQGVLRSSSEDPLDGTYDMTFRFHGAAVGGDEILVDIHTAGGGAPVTVGGGLFNVSLGGGVVTDGAGPGTYASLREVFRDYGDVYLSVQVGAEVLSPRVRVISTGYALNADHLDGKDSTGFAQVASGNTFSTGTQTVQTGAAATKGLVIQGAASQSANLQEWQDDAGSMLASVSASGALSATSFTGDGAGLTNVNETLTAGTGLAGGSYDGSSAGTFSVSYGTSAGTAVQGDQTATVTAGSGLTGGASADPLGDGFSATLEIGAGNGIAVAADSIGLGPLAAEWNQTGAFDISLNHPASELRIRESAGPFFGTLDVGDLGQDNTYTFTSGGTVWTSGNDGGATGLDADRIDSLDSLQFLRSDTSDTMIGSLTILGSTSSLTLAATGTNTQYKEAGIDRSSANNEEFYVDNTGAGDITLLIGGDIVFDTGDNIRRIYNNHDLQFRKDENSGNTSFFRFLTDGGTIEQMRIQDGDEANTLFDGAVTANGIDYAEAFQVSDGSLEPGDVVALDLKRPGYCVRSSRAHEHGLLGVVSGKPGFLTGMSFDAEDEADPEVSKERDAARMRGDDEEERRLTVILSEIAERTHRPIALLGRVPVKVDGGFGPIRPGDHLTSSPTPGHAMTMSGPGRSLGVALESWDKEITGTVLAFIQPGWVGSEAFSGSENHDVTVVPVPTDSGDGDDFGRETGPIVLDHRDGSRAASPQLSCRAVFSLQPVTETVGPGDVLVLDRERPGLMRLGATAGDPAVAGIVAKEPEAAPEGPASNRTEVPVAQTGIVPCKVDAGYGAIQVGDLLTTSPTPGHAMRASDPLPGTIIGKAVEPWGSGAGLIKVLIALR